MKKVLLLSMALTCLMLWSCAKDDEAQVGSIYGIVTEEGTAEPIRGLSVELRKGIGAYFDQEEKQWAAESVIVLMRATTFNDGHFECTDLEPGVYAVIVDNSMYIGESGPIRIEAGRQTKVDILVRKKSSY